MVTLFSDNTRFNFQKNLLSKNKDIRLAIYKQESIIPYELGKLNSFLKKIHGQEFGNFLTDSYFIYRQYHV